MTERWNIDRAAVLNSLMGIITGDHDPKLQIEAATVLVRADLADVKREELEMRKQKADDDKRLRLLEIARHIPAADLARIASEHEAVCDIGRQDGSGCIDGQEASGSS